MLDRTLTVISGSDQSPSIDYTDDTDWLRNEFAMTANGGESSACSIIIRDEGGVIPDYQGLRYLFGHNVVRATVGSNTLFRGRIAEHDASRGPAAAGREHEFSVTLEDQNSHLGRIIVHNWVRPAETDKARVQALMAAYLSASPRVTTNLNGSNYVSASNTVSLPAKTFSGVTPGEILREIASNADKEMFVTVDNEMFYDGHDSTAYTSLLRISDDPADASSVTYAPWSPSGLKAARDVTSHLRVYYGSDTIQQSVQVSRPGVAPEYDYAEDIYWDSESTTAAQAIARADKMLAADSTGAESYSCAIGPMNGDQIYKIKVGQTIQFKSRAARSGRFSNGQYIGDSFRVVRIRELRWEMPAVDTYIAHLRLDRWRPLGKSKGNQALTTQPPFLGTGAGFHDTFSRTANTFWGTSDSGHTWTKTGSPGSATTSGNFGIISGAGIFLQEEAGEVLETDANYWRLTSRFMVSTTPSNGTDFLGSLTLTWNVGDSLSVYIAWDDATVATDPYLKLLGEGTNPQVDYPTFQFSQGNWYQFKWERDVTKQISRVKLWRELDGEPTDWIINETADLFDYRPTADHRKVRFDVTTTNQGSSITTVATDEIHLVADDTVALVFGEI